MDPRHRAPASLDRQARIAHGHGHAPAGAGPGRHARPRRSRAAARRHRAAAVALAVLPAAARASPSWAPDGHPQRGGFLPPVPLPRRMWAGSRLELHAPLRVGDALQRTSRIADVSAQGGAHRAAGVRAGAPRGEQRARAGADRGARHRLPRQPAAGRPGAATAGRAGRCADWRARDRARRRAAVPLFGAHLQRPPHPLRPPLRDRGRGLSRAWSCTGR